ncbi:uncharacterized protein LOC129749725 [Uranotaenia lowii]|uniref:uncharacterized protein LOC129749725 n=1 Tax=Uranotaenia lowii TaxID=190385 RepID=UPI00247AE109|nr:uncharacterized protein LOC129749725 [Uranotaenia lowii]XP_055600764.1 uncharacterized protein LOC129749725 [Uranotaenia lowii]XP_055600773.1 uncharacterized protein LOC129749725 [Uranotaenia lowii]XP_055600782.1 uncharacterized protein LOC129749725 [Uranotaenia lowii]XP_055600788.1 uncharacterized protein LOC129749725 [Uranotaenia lowii]XP_055600796.1 uncharacterized protein LOC129749725 [Uranotaenia lowii]XP_055600803.1 uncharacterized protein LOC129749725 [Uranotaenia lowii]
MEESSEVVLYIYDLTQGMASMMSQMLLGRHIDGIWHTAVVVFGREYFFGSQGITSCLPGATVLGQPLKKEVIGRTFIPQPVFADYVRGLAESSFRGSRYNLLQHNCNTFSEDLCQFLCGIGIPKYILDLPQEFLSTPLGQTLGPLIASLGSGGDPTANFQHESDFLNGYSNGGGREPSPDLEQLNHQIEQARQQSQELTERRNKIRDKIDKKSKKKDKKSRKDRSSGESDQNSNGMSEAEAESMNGNGSVNGDSIPPEMLPSEKVLKEEEAERLAEEERKKNREQPIIFKEVDPKLELECLVNLVDGKLSEEEQVAVDELHQYLLLGEGAWALGDGFLVFVGRVFRDKSLSTEVRVHLLRALANAALKDDIILLLHQDRREHVLMNFAQDIDRHPPEEQQAIALFMCNLFENDNASEWLLYISEWAYNNQTISNIRATTKVAVHCLLATCPRLKEIGTALVYNLAAKEVKTVVFDDVAVEISMALLQFFNTDPTEEHLFRTMRSLAKFVLVSPDVPQFIQMIGPHPKTFRGKSERINDQIDQISKKVR